MTKPLTTTSTTNTHALSVYACLALTGAYFTFVTAQPALYEMYGGYIAHVLMGFVMISGAGAFIAAIRADRSKDPSSGLVGEMSTLVPLSLILAVLLYSFFKVYGTGEAPTTILFTLTFFVGCFGRLIQAWVEYRNVSRARRSSMGEKVKVTADPEES